eukprot:1633161-Heterocapsa_arctica.AAC.1
MAHQGRRSDCIWTGVCKTLSQYARRAAAVCRQRVRLGLRWRLRPACGTTGRTSHFVSRLGNVK